MKMKLSHYLFRCLENLGVEYTFGIPGDFALPLYSDQADFGMKTIVCAHEPGCVFAADAYSRLKNFGAVLSTYGVGGLNMINAVAMAYAEYSPIVIISGAPALSGRKKKPFFHHLVKDYGSQQRVYSEVTCATTAITRAETAVEEIDRVLTDIQKFKRPGYIEIPLDLTSIEVAVPRKNYSSPTLQSKNSLALNEVANEIISAFEKARHPIIYAGLGVRRFGLVEKLVRIAENWGLPVVSSVMGKASFPETHQNFVGVFMGKMGDEHAYEMLESSDLIIAIGVIFSDLNSGFWTSEVPTENLININNMEVNVSYHNYEGVLITDLISHIATLTPPRKKLQQFNKQTEKRLDDSSSTSLTVNQLIRVLRQTNQAQYCYIADVGDALFAGLELDTNCFLAPGYYASMGFAVPGAVGAALARPDLRSIVLVGDGAFQMTGNELSTLVFNKLNPIIIVLNNGYYKMLSALDKHRDYYNLNTWNYVKYAEALGCPGERATTENELQHAFANALEHKSPFLIEAILDKDDHAPIMKRIKEHIHKSN